MSIDKNLFIEKDYINVPIQIPFSIIAMFI